MRNIKPFLSLAAAAALAVSLTACGGAKLAGVVMPEELSLTVGDVAPVEAVFTADKDGLSADELNALAEKANAQFKVEDETIATYADGEVTAKKAGKTTLTIAVGDLSATTKIMVKEVVTGIEAPSNVEVAVGEEAVALDVKVTPADAEVKFAYESSDETIATVDQDGKISAVSAGECVVTVKAQDTDLAAEVKVVVTGSADGNTTSDKKTDSAEAAEKQDTSAKTESTGGKTSAAGNTSSDSKKDQTINGQKPTTPDKKPTTPDPTPAPVPPAPTPAPVPPAPAPTPAPVPPAPAPDVETGDMSGYIKPDGSGWIASENGGDATETPGGYI